MATPWAFGLGEVLTAFAAHSGRRGPKEYSSYIGRIMYNRRSKSLGSDFFSPGERERESSESGTSYMNDAQIQPLVQPVRSGWQEKGTLSPLQSFCGVELAWI